jgi:hypothetical protein
MVDVNDDRETAIRLLVNQTERPDSRLPESLNQSRHVERILST